MSTPGSELRRLRSLVADLDAVVWEADADSFAFTFVSEGVAQVLGYTAHDWLSRPGFWAEHVHPDDRDRALEAFSRSATEGLSHDVEYRFLAADGEYTWIRELGHAVTDAHGTALIVRGLMIDVTVRRATEDQHKDAEARYRTLVERLPAIVYIESLYGAPNEPGRLLYVSPQVEQILGYTPRQWLDDPVGWADAFHPDDLERVREELQRVQETGELTAEYRMLARDGRTVWFRDDAVLVRSREGSPLFWQGVMYDISQERESAERAHGSQARFRALVEQLPAIVYSEPLTEGELAIEYVSPQAEELLGVSPAEWLENPTIWLRSIHPEDRARVEQANEDADRSKAPFVAEYRMVARDGRTRWFHDEAKLVRDESGNAVMWQGVMVDITDQKRAEMLEQDLRVERETARRLRELDEMKNTFLQAVSHDLRTPLAAILGLAVTLGRSDMDLEPGEVQEMAARIATNARKLDRLVNDLLDLDRLGRGIVEPVLRSTDVAELVAVIAGETDLLGDRPMQVDARSVVVPVDAAKLERIVENLLANTAKHTPVRTRVWVRVEPFEGGALISVEDDGPGVQEQFRSEIFEPFRRGPSSPEHAPGVGVGLSLVARFAELHGGRAWVDERPGGGAAFHVLLPGGSQAADAEDAASAPSDNQA